LIFQPKEVLKLVLSNLSVDLRGLLEVTAIASIIEPLSLLTLNSPVVVPTVKRGLATFALYVVGFILLAPTLLRTVFRYLLDKASSLVPKSSLVFSTLVIEGFVRKFFLAFLAISQEDLLRRLLSLEVLYGESVPLDPPIGSDSSKDSPKTLVRVSVYSS
jgi:hypothetical protein